MISLYSGTPGSGKSLHVAEKIYYRLRLGKPVICNFDINRDLFKKRKIDFHLRNNWDLDISYLIEFSREYFKGKKIKEDEILLVIDECQLIFNARDWNKAGRSDWLSFFTQHRKYGYHVILIAQFDNMIDKQIRAVIEYEYKHRKVSNFGIQGKLLSIFMGGHTFVAVKVWYPLKEKVGSEFFHAKKKFFRLYDTFGDFNVKELPAATENPGAGVRA